jgi:hypothetical protein
MEETTKSIWNKTASELTVKDNLIVAFAYPAVAVAGICAIGYVAGAGMNAYDKFRKRNVVLETIETDTDTES